MILSNLNIERELRRALLLTGNPYATDRLIVEPRLPQSIRPASIDLRLHHELLSYTPGKHYDPRRGYLPKPTVIDMNKNSSYTLEPGEWILGATLEHVEIPSHLVGILSGKSTWARVGLSIEDAGYVDPGWKGRLTLEIKNNGPLWVTLYPEMWICQLRLDWLRTPVNVGYDEWDDSHYQGSMGPVAAITGKAFIGSPEVDQYGREIQKDPE